MNSKRHHIVCKNIHHSMLHHHLARPVIHLHTTTAIMLHHRRLIRKTSKLCLIAR